MVPDWEMTDVWRLGLGNIPSLVLLRRSQNKRDNNDISISDNIYDAYLTGSIEADCDLLIQHHPVEGKKNNFSFKGNTTLQHEGARKATGQHFRYLSLPNTRHPCRQAKVNF